MSDKPASPARGRKKTAPPAQQSPQEEVVVRLPLADLYPFPDHPFQVRDDEEMRETIQSVKEYGVIVPAIVRPREEGGYEIVAGHRRKYACEQAGLDTMPVLIRNLDRDAATIIMVDSNLQRENILPSERAKAYKMKLEAIKRQGARNDLTSPKISAKLRSDDEIGQQMGVSGDTVRNYISLTNLVPELMQMVDEKKIALSPAYQIAALKPEEQQMQYGESLSRGAELALKQYNEKNGTDYVIEIMDDKGDPKEAVNVANLIVSDPTVIAGMGSFSSSCAMAAAPVFEEADLLLFSPNASHTDFPAMGENMFSAVMSQKYEGAEFADALIEMFGAQNVAILYQNTDHGVIATDVFTKQYEAGGGKVIMSETFIPGQTKDFSPVLSRIKEQDPDLFYVNASYNDCAQIFMQAKALNMDCQLVGPGMLLTEEFLDVVGNKIDGTIVMSSVPAFLPSVLESGELDAASKNFVDSYTAEYNEVPDGFAASAFDAVNIVLDAVAKVGTDTPALREELKTLRDYPGVSGYNMSFNEQKEMVKGIYLFEIQDGQFVRVK